jgi:hypothetical protein
MALEKYDIKARGDARFLENIQFNQENPPVILIGEHGNAWNAAALGADAVSAVIDTKNHAVVSVFGNASGATDVTVQYSQDGVNFYKGDVVSLAAAGDFKLDLTTGARYIRLKSSALTVTVTATVAGK